MPVHSFNSIQDITLDINPFHAVNKIYHLQALIFSGMNILKFGGVCPKASAIFQHFSPSCDFLHNKEQHV
jgi:hypothetical protein